MDHKVKVSHMCTTNVMNYIPIFLQLLKELPQLLCQVVEKGSKVTPLHPVLIEKRGVFRTSQVCLPITYKTNTIDFDVEIIMTNFEM